MSVKREGYLLIDHRNSPGVPGLAPIFESAAYTCNHCHGIVVTNPDRARMRGFCPGCRSVICDNCTAIRAVTMKCKTMDQIIDETLEAVQKQTATGAPSILLR
jgi:hypothetical protein